MKEFDPPNLQGYVGKDVYDSINQNKKQPKIKKKAQLSKKQTMKVH